MYQYLFDDNTTQKLQDSTTKTKNMLEKFSDVDKKYTFGNKTDSKLTLKKIDYIAPDQNQVLSEAENSLNGFKNNSIDKINNNYALKNEQIDSSIKAVKDNTKSKKAEIEQTYANVKQNAQNDAIKRGLARSSIIVNKLDNYNNRMLNDLEVLSSESNSKIDALTTEKNTLELEKSNALKSFDIEYASKLQDKINSINEDIKKNEQAVIKYNNEIAEIEAKWNNAIEQENYSREKDMADFYAKNGSFVVESLKRNEKYQIAKEYFAQLDKKSALAELKNNSAYKENLGEVNYNKLLSEIENN